MPGNLNARTTGVLLVNTVIRHLSADAYAQLKQVTVFSYRACGGIHNLCQGRGINGTGRVTLAVAVYIPDAPPIFTFSPYAVQEPTGVVARRRRARAPRVYLEVLAT